MSLRFWLLGLVCFMAANAWPQDPQVRDVRFEQQGGQIVIRYNLFGRPGKKHSVSVELSDDNGRTFRIKPVSVEGDVGKDVRTGSGKSIIWNMQRDLPQGLEGEDFVFAVNAKLQKGAKTWPYLLGLAAAGGAGAYYFMSKEDKGEITIRVPADM